MYNINLKVGCKMVLSKAFKTKLFALKFINNIKNDVCCFGCTIVFLKRESSGEYIEINNWLC